MSSTFSVPMELITSAGSGRSCADIAERPAYHIGASIISETGIAPGAGKVATLHQLFSGVRAQHLLGFVYFDGNQPQGANYHYRWRLEDSPAAMAEYATLSRQYDGDGQDAPNSADTVASKP
jgi:hypothetical protein